MRDFSNHRHTIDAISVDRIACELQQENSSPLIAYKPQGQVNKNYPMLKIDSFFLVVMTEFQSTLFKDFSSLACVDSTHKTNQYGYKLVTLLVVDEFRKGIATLCFMYNKITFGDRTACCLGNH